MDAPENVVLKAEWGGRPESVESQAAMMWDSWRRLAEHGGFLSDQWAHSTGKDTGAPVTSLEALTADMEKAMKKPGDTYCAFSTVTKQTSVPDLAMYAEVSAPAVVGQGTNSLTVRMQAGDDTPDSLPVRWLLGLGADLVKGLVDAWQPDAVTLLSDELVSLKPDDSTQSARPAIGFITWLSDEVANARRLPRAHIRERYQDGTLIGINPKSRNPLRDASRLASRLYGSSALGSVPSVQGQPKREMLGDAQWGDWATGDDEKKAARSDAAVLPAGTTLAFPVAYTTLDDTVEYVWFDDFTTFGYPPTEFLIDYKYGYRNPIVDQPWAGASDAQCARWLTEARTKLNVIDQAGGGDLIWEFSDNDVANAVRHYFVANGLDRVIIACVPQI